MESAPFLVPRSIVEHGLYMPRVDTAKTPEPKPRSIVTLDEATDLLGMRPTHWQFALTDPRAEISDADPRLARFASIRETNRPLFFYEDEILKLKAWLRLDRAIDPISSSWFLFWFHATCASDVRAHVAERITGIWLKPLTSNERRLCSQRMRNLSLARKQSKRALGGD